MTWTPDEHAAAIQRAGELRRRIDAVTDPILDGQPTETSKED